MIPPIHKSPNEDCTSQKMQSFISTSEEEEKHKIIAEMIGKW